MIFEDMQIERRKTEPQQPELFQYWPIIVAVIMLAVGWGVNGIRVSTLESQLMLLRDVPVSIARLEVHLITLQLQIDKLGKVD